MNFKEIIIKAVDENVDVDSKGKFNGYEFAARQIIRDLDRIGYQLMTPGGRKVSVKIRGEL